MSGTVVVREPYSSSDYEKFTPTDGVNYVLDQEIEGYTVVYNGTDELYTDFSITPGAAYRYESYAYDTEFNYSSSGGTTGAVSSMVEDSPPDRLLDFSAEGGLGFVVFRGTLPSDEDSHSGRILILEKYGEPVTDIPVNGLVDGMYYNIGDSVGESIVGTILFTPEQLENESFPPNLNVTIPGNYYFIAFNESDIRYKYSAGLVTSAAAGGEVDLYLGLFGSETNLFYSDNKIFVVYLQGGLRILDVSDPISPSELSGSYDSFYPMGEISVNGNYAYVVENDFGNTGWLRILNISEPSNPVLEGSYETTTLKDLLCLDTTVYLSGTGNGLQIINILDPENPVLESGFDTPGTTFGIHYDGIRYAYVVDDDSIQILDLIDTANPVFLSKFLSNPSGSTSTGIEHLVMGSGYLYTIKAGTDIAPHRPGIFPVQ